MWKNRRGGKLVEKKEGRKRKDGAGRERAWWLKWEEREEKRGAREEIGARWEWGGNCEWKEKRMGIRNSGVAFLFPFHPASHLFNFSPLPFQIHPSLFHFLLKSIKVPSHESTYVTFCSLSLLLLSATFSPLSLPPLTLPSTVSSPCISLLLIPSCSLLFPYHHHHPHSQFLPPSHPFLPPFFPFYTLSHISCPLLLFFPLFLLSQFLSPSHLFLFPCSFLPSPLPLISCSLTFSFLALLVLFSLPHTLLPSHSTCPLLFYSSTVALTPSSCPLLIHSFPLIFPFIPSLIFPTLFCFVLLCSLLSPLLFSLLFSSFSSSIFLSQFLSPSYLFLFHYLFLPCPFSSISAPSSPITCPHIFPLNYLVLVILFPFPFCFFQCWTVIY